LRRGAGGVSFAVLSLSACKVNSAGHALLWLVVSCVTSLDAGALPLRTTGPKRFTDHPACLLSTPPLK